MTIQHLELSGLSLKDALDLATLIEEEAHERYLELADQMEQHRTPEPARFFRFMAENVDSTLDRLWYAGRNSSLLNWKK